jgi:hypothetical protein
MTVSSHGSADATRSAISELAGAFNKSNAAFVATGMAAVETALRFLGVGAGDRVVVPVECCYTVAAGVLRAGADPVFVESGRALVVTGAEAAIAASIRPRVAIAVHCFGLPCDVRAWREHFGPDVPIVEDASLAFGISHNRSTIGTYADVVIASLGKGKPIDLGEGGLVLTNDDVSGLLDRRSPRSRMRPEPPLPFPLSPFALQALPEAMVEAKRRLDVRRGVASQLIPGLRALGFEVVDLAAGDAPGWHRIPIWGGPDLHRRAQAANAEVGQAVAQPSHPIDVPDLPMFRGRGTRIGRDARETDRLLLIRTEPAGAVREWYRHLSER